MHLQLCVTLEVSNMQRFVWYPLVRHPSGPDFSLNSSLEAEFLFG